jgi:hypothetical protein
MSVFAHIRVNRDVIVVLLRVRGRCHDGWP